MSTRRIGSSDLEVAPICLGGNVFGWTADRDASFEVLDAFLSGGGNFVDTADSYSRWVPGNSGGESESIIGDWLQARGSRDKVIVATKVFSHPEYRGLSPANVRAAADASLTRLRTDRIDLYYAHHEDDRVPLEESVAVFSELVDAGKVRAIGLSNFRSSKVEEWIRIANAGGYHAPVALQPEYNLMERGFESDGQLATAQSMGLGVLPYYSLASGFLAGKYRDAADAHAAGASDRADDAAKYLTPKGASVLTALDRAAAAHGVEVASVALAWLRAQPTIVAPIASARSTAQLPALLASASLELTLAEIEELTGASE